MRQEAWVFHGWTTVSESDGLTCKTGLEMKHRYPGWMPLKLHIILEGFMDKLKWGIEIISLWEIYDFLYGVICGYPQREIVNYIRRFHRAKRILRGMS